MPSRPSDAYPIDPPHGLESPVGRVYQLDGQETAFLHPPGVDGECDEERASLASGD